MSQPTRRELMLEMGQLDPAVRRRVYRMARSGEAASDPREAALVVAVARRNLSNWRSGFRWFFVLAAIWLVFGLIWIIVSGKIAWGLLDILIAVVISAKAIQTQLRQVPRWRRAGSLNVIVANGKEADQERPRPT